METKIDFVNEDTGKALMKMVMPLLAAMVLMMAYNLVDSLWVGNLLGELGYAALTTVGSVSMLLYAITTGIGNGTAVVVSQLVGAGDKRKTEEMIGTALRLSALFAVSMTLVLEIALRDILILFGTPAELLVGAKDYLGIFLLGYGAIFLYMQLTSIYRSFGDPMFQMKGMLLGTVVNVIVDPLFIKGMGISGAAIATVLSQVLCLIYAVIYGKKKGLLKVGAFRREIVIPLLKVAVPSSFQNCVPAVSSMVMVILINRFDVTTIAAYGIVKNIETLLFYPAMAMNMGLITIIGQLYGAGRRERIRDYMKAALICGGGLEAVLMLPVLAFSGRISMAFVKEAAVAGIVSHGMMIIGIGYLCYMITSIFTAKMAGMGRVRMSMGLMVLYYIVFRVPLAAVLIRGSLGLDGIWVAILISHLLAVVIAAILQSGEYPGFGKTLVAKDRLRRI